MRHRKPREIKQSTYNPIPRMMNVRLTLLLWSVLITHTYGQVSEKNSNATTGAVSDVQLIDQLPEGSIYEKIWQPFLARWSDTHYVVAYGLQLKGKGDMGDIVCSISPDQGKTWSTPIMIFDHRQPNGTQQFAYNNAVLFKPNNSDVLWCFAMRAPQHYRDSEDSELVAAYSGDGGSSWHPVELVMEFHSPIITCAGIVEVKENGKTRYLLPVHRNTKRHDPRGDREQFVLESESLLKWKLAGYVPQPQDQKVFLHEGNIAYGSDSSELKMVMRTAQYEDGGKALEPPRAYSSVSTDGGRTWSVAQPEPDLYNSVAKGFYGKDSLGRHIYVYNDGPAWERRALQYMVKPEGQSWSAPQLFYEDNNRNSYPTLIEEKPGVWVGAWDSSNDSDRKRTAIRFGRLVMNQP